MLRKKRGNERRDSELIPDAIKTRRKAKSVPNRAHFEIIRGSAHHDVTSCLFEPRAGPTKLHLLLVSSPINLFTCRATTKNCCEEQMNYDWSSIHILRTWNDWNKIIRGFMSLQICSITKFYCFKLRRISSWTKFRNNGWCVYAICRWRV